MGLLPLRGLGPTAWWRGRRRGPLAGTRLLQVPYRLFQVRVCNGGRERVQWLAVDAITGALDLYAFERAPESGALAASAEGQVLPEIVAPDRLRAVVEECVRRHVYAAGFFRLHRLAIEVEDAGRTLFVPYRVGVRGSGPDAPVEVIGGLRNRREGARLRDALRPWITAPRARA